MKKYILLAILLIPNITFAIPRDTWTQHDTLVLVLSIINYIVVGVIIASLFLFFLNFSKYIKLKKNDEGRKNNKKLMIHCVVTIVIALFIWQIDLFLLSLTEGPCCVLVPPASSGPVLTY